VKLAKLTQDLFGFLSGPGTSPIAADTEAIRGWCAVAGQSQAIFLAFQNKSDLGGLQGYNVPRHACLTGKSYDSPAAQNSYRLLLTFLSCVRNAIVAARTTNRAGSFQS
jgi:hypothetical protein